MDEEELTVDEQPEDVAQAEGDEEAEEEGGDEGASGNKTIILTYF